MIKVLFMFTFKFFGLESTKIFIFNNVFNFEFKPQFILNDEAKMNARVF